MDFRYSLEQSCERSTGVPYFTKEMSEKLDNLSSVKSWESQLKRQLSDPKAQAAFASVRTIRGEVMWKVAFNLPEGF